MSELENQLEALLSPLFDEVEFSLVKITLKDQKPALLQVFFERVDELPLSHKDCSKMTRKVSEALDQADLIKEAYTLEVSSPGIDRPLVKLKDFIKHIGFEIKILLNTKINDAKKFQGTIVNIEDDKIILDAMLKQKEGPGMKPGLKPGQTQVPKGKGEDLTTRISIPFEACVEAKLVLNDHLLQMKRPPIELMEA